MLCTSLQLTKRFNIFDRVSLAMLWGANASKPPVWELRTETRFASLPANRTEAKIHTLRLSPSAVSEEDMGGWTGRRDQSRRKKPLPNSELFMQASRTQRALLAVSELRERACRTRERIASGILAPCHPTYCLGASKSRQSPSVVACSCLIRSEAWVLTNCGKLEHFLLSTREMQNS